MSAQRTLIAIVLTAALLALTSVLLPKTVYAECGLAGVPPCGTWGDKQKVPTKTPLPTHTAIAIQPILPVIPLTGLGTSTPTIPPDVLTATAQSETASAQQPTPVPTETPTPGADAPAPPAGQAFTALTGALRALPGTGVIIIVVALMGLAFAGLTFLKRRRRKANSQEKPPNSSTGSRPL